MKTDRNTNCFKYVTIYKTSCSWCTRAVGGWWRKGWGCPGRGGLWAEEGEGTGREGWCQKNDCHVGKFQSLRTWRKEVWEPEGAILPEYMIIQENTGNWQRLQIYKWTCRLLLFFFPLEATRCQGHSSFPRECSGPRFPYELCTPTPTTSFSPRVTCGEAIICRNASV